jgi:NitT/TauT family transport system ATP-binding protein
MNATAASSLVRLHRVEKRYPNGARALADLDLAVGRADFLALLGPSGCGKSTALRVLAGLLAPSAGRLQWAADLPEEIDGAPRLGFVFQEPALMPWARVAENVYLPLRLRGMPRDAAAESIDDALRRVGLAGHADAWPRELSGGMRMRVSIARALVTRPRLLLLDEPFAALDEITRLRLNEDLLALRAEQGFAVVFVTHSVYESVYLANRVAVMAARPGRVVAELAIDEPYPRLESFRTSARYNAHCIAVSQALRAAFVAKPADVAAPG